MVYRVVYEKQKGSNRPAYYVKKMCNNTVTDKVEVTEEEAKIIANIEYSRAVNFCLTNDEIKEYIRYRIKDEDLKNWLLSSRI